MVTIQWEVWVWVFFFCNIKNKKKGQDPLQRLQHLQQHISSLQLTSLFLVLLQQLRASTIADAFPPTHQLICKCTQVVEIMKCWMLLYWQVLLSGGGCCRRGAKIRCFSVHAKGKTRHTKLGHETWSTANRAHQLLCLLLSRWNQKEEILSKSFLLYLFRYL